MRTVGSNTQSEGPTNARKGFVERQVARIRRLNEPRDLLRSIVTKYLLPSNFFPEWLVFRALKVSGFQVVEPCGFSGARIQTPSLTVGVGTWANRGVSIEGRGAVSIGEGVLIGPEVLIVTSTHERTSDGLVRADSTYRPVHIGNRCWIGARAMVLPGVSISDGVTVAAGAVVVCDIGPGGLYGGVPARRLK